ncbi:MAG: YgiT-type zinc finger protein [Thermoguttaceae bacterium]
MKPIRTCPSCGSKHIKRVQGTWHGVYQGQKYTVKNLAYHECPDCGEKVYDREAMQAIESQSPAFAKLSTSAE